MLWCTIYIWVTDVLLFYLLFEQTINISNIYLTKHFFSRTTSQHTKNCTIWMSLKIKVNEQCSPFIFYKFLCCTLHVTFVWKLPTQLRQYEINICVHPVMYVVPMWWNMLFKYFFTKFDFFNNNKMQQKLRLVYNKIKKITFKKPLSKWCKCSVF